MFGDEYDACNIYDAYNDYDKYYGFSSVIRNHELENTMDVVKEKITKIDEGDKRDAGDYEEFNSPNYNVFLRGVDTTRVDDRMKRLEEENERATKKLYEKYLSMRPETPISIDYSTNYYPLYTAIAVDDANTLASYLGQISTSRLHAIYILSNSLPVEKYKARRFDKNPFARAPDHIIIDRGKENEVGDGLIFMAPVFYAVLRGARECLKYCLVLGVNINLRCEFFSSPLALTGYTVWPAPRGFPPSKKPKTFVVPNKSISSLISYIMMRDKKTNFKHSLFDIVRENYSYGLYVPTHHLLAVNEALRGRHYSGFFGENKIGNLYGMKNMELKYKITIFGLLNIIKELIGYTQSNKEFGYCGYDTPIIKLINHFSRNIDKPKNKKIVEMLKEAICMCDFAETKLQIKRERDITASNVNTADNADTENSTPYDVFSFLENVVFDGEFEDFMPEIEDFSDTSSPRILSDKYNDNNITDTEDLFDQLALKMFDIGDSTGFENSKLMRRKNDDDLARASASRSENIKYTIYSFAGVGSNEYPNPRRFMRPEIQDVKSSEKTEHFNSMIIYKILYAMLQLDLRDELLYLIEKKVINAEFMPVLPFLVMACCEINNIGGGEVPLDRYTEEDLGSLKTEGGKMKKYMQRRFAFIEYIIDNLGDDHRRKQLNYYIKFDEKIKGNSVPIRHFYERVNNILLTDGIAGSNANKFNWISFNSIHIAQMYGEIEILRILMSKGAHIRDPVISYFILSTCSGTFKNCYIRFDMCDLIYDYIAHNKMENNANFRRKFKKKKRIGLLDFKILCYEHPDIADEMDEKARIEKINKVPMNAILRKITETYEIVCDFYPDRENFSSFDKFCAVFEGAYVV